MPTGIYKRTIKHKQNIAKTKRGIKRPPFSVEWKQNISNGHKGLKHTEKTKTKMKGNKYAIKHGLCSKDKKYYCVDCKKLLSNYKAKRCQSCSKRELWKNKEFREKTIRATFKVLQLTPNNLEKQLNKLLQRLLPKEYKFVGNFKFWIERFNPDFINCNGKKIIELYGDYWHNKTDHKKRDKNRIKMYKKYGYKTLIVWEHELRDFEMLIAKIMEFEL